MKRKDTITIYHRFKSDWRSVYVGRTVARLLPELNIEILLKLWKPYKALCIYSDESIRCNKKCKYKFKCILESL
jgi:hypothetical protein